VSFAQPNREIFHTVIALLIYQANSAKLLNRDGGNQKIVLVDIVEGANRPKTNIASVVSGYLVDKQDGKIGQGFLYNSIRGMGTRIVPVFCHRERDLISPFAQHGNDGVVQSGSKIVDYIADDEANLDWRRLNGSDLDDLVAGVRLDIDDNFAKVRVEESLKGRIKLLDVAVGPRNL
jgi:hypothetical protein